MNKISVAPMVDRTTKEFRNFFRMFNKSSTLYTEMISAQAIINGDIDRLLKFNDIEHPIALQIATHDKDYAKEAIKIANKYNYDSININAGCPSDRVSNNKMGAYLMSEPELIVSIANEIRKVTDKPITLKHRIGIDGKGILEDDRLMDSYEELLEFVDKVSNNTDINKYIIHARIAILKGLSPSENRTIPPIDYDRVYRLKKERPNLNIEINGGIKTLEEVENHLKYVDSVMIGRQAYDNPMLLNEFNISRYEIIEKLIKYIEENKEVKPYHITMHSLGLFHSTKYSKIWKNVASNSRIESTDLKNFLKELDKE
ncbi:tRNA dihydrouridine(20/20a) synthase DusA [Oceanivirga miroungae]|uniref:Dihydrouridine synthase n=1 Tax=Oceanivirga miroungae TaxID=1130046 RepID=A0A6I8MCC2_9FUSO|nr:tRNA dihydrouridine(20/20a) synthase DusA [Oceanivirga miroungae]VWL85079.1 dihydrouridine synthase [Oceanivirga miroungae]